MAQFTPIDPNDPEATQRFMQGLGPKDLITPEDPRYNAQLNPFEQAGIGADILAPPSAQNPRAQFDPARLGLAIGTTTGIGGLFAAAKALKAAGGLTRTGIEAARTGRVAGLLNRPASVTERLAQGGPQGALYKIAENVEGSVPTGGIKEVVDRVARLSQLDPAAKSELQALSGELRQGTIPYKDLVAKEQTLGTQLYDSYTNARLRDIRQAMVSASSPVSPALTEANAATAHFHSSEELLRAITGKNGTAARNAVDRVVSQWSEYEPFRIKALGLDDPVKLEQLRSAAASGRMNELIRGGALNLGRHAGWAIPLGVGGAYGYRHFGR